MQITGLHHATVVVTDLDRAASFYRDALGLREIPIPTSFAGAGLNVRWFAVGDAGAVTGSIGNPTTWTSYAPVTSERLNGVAMVAGNVTAVGDNGVIVVGSGATSYSVAPAITTRTLRAVATGSGEAIVSLEDELFTVHAAPLRALLAPLARSRGSLPAPALALLRRVAQAMAESTSRSTRMASLQQDRRWASLLAFSGRGE
mgnify:CR=1 FL=1